MILLCEHMCTRNGEMKDSVCTGIRCMGTDSEETYLD